ncbi:MAG: complex I subunit 5 family protein, partial [bacterium]|nr:complex I subunit 5 family protein [bacterium]
MSQLDYLILLPILLPLGGGIVIALTHRWYSKIGKALVSVIAAATFGAILVVFLLDRPLHVEFARLVDYGLSLEVTPLGIIMALLTAFLWLLASIYSLVYLEHDHSPVRFYSFFFLTLAGTMGVFLAADYFSLFLFFELMTFCAYPLVVHEEDQRALSAGNVYLYLSVIGGLVLLFGIFALVSATGSASMQPALDSIAQSSVGIYVLAGAFLVGFGVKAGIIPLHIWLPKAHPVAPSPASAMLSGIMIKTGVYGIIRVFMTTLSSATGKATYTHSVQNLGLAIIFISLVTMIGGAIMALLQDNLKRILAYSSISQIGYILLAVGSAVYLAKDGGLAYTGAIYHIVNHAVFKSGL